MFALVLKEKVVDIVKEPFPVHESMSWVELSAEEDVQIGDVYRENAFVRLVEELTNYEKRLREYPRVSDQLDMLWHAMDAKEIPVAVEFYNAIKAVKEKFPLR